MSTTNHKASTWIRRNVSIEGSMVNPYLGIYYNSRSPEGKFGVTSGTGSRETFVGLFHTLNEAIDARKLAEENSAKTQDRKVGYYAALNTSRKQLAEQEAA